MDCGNNAGLLKLMQQVGDQIWNRISAFVKEQIEERLARSGFTGTMISAGNVSGSGGSGLVHSVTAHVAGVLGELLYAASAGAWTRLAGNTTTTKKFLRQTGTGSASAAPAWDTIVDGDLPATLAGKSMTTMSMTNPTLVGYIQGEEIADPAAPAANNGRLYFRDNGSGKTQLVVIFPTGVVQIVATEP